MGTFWDSTKNNWFSHKTRLVFEHGNVFKERSQNSATFKIELFVIIGNGRVYNQWTVVSACCWGNSTIFTSKIKIRWKWSCLEGGIRSNFLFCRYLFTFFRKYQLLSVSLPFCFILKINFKNGNWYHCQIHLLKFYQQKQPSTNALKNVVNKTQKFSCEVVLFKKN